MSKTQAGSDRPITSGMPRWVKVSLIIVIILIVLFVILHFTGNGFGPSMHMSTIVSGVQQL